MKNNQNEVDLYDEVQKVGCRNPTVHAGLSLVRYKELPYQTALELMVLQLVQQNEGLIQRLMEAELKRPIIIGPLPAGKKS